MELQTLLLTTDSSVDELLWSEMESFRRMIEMENQFRSISEIIDFERQMKTVTGDALSVLNSTFLDVTLSGHSSQLDAANRLFLKSTKFQIAQMKKNQEFARKVNLHANAIAFPNSSQGKEHLN
jgi:hypothetical protein